MTQSPSNPDQPLSLDIDSIRRQALVAIPTDDPGIETEATALLSRLDTAHIQSSNSDLAEAIEQIGEDSKRSVTRRSQMLRKPIAELARNSEDGGPVAKGLLDLRKQVDDLNPHNFDFTDRSTWWSGLLGGTKPIQQYFMKYQPAERVIADIVQSINEGSDRLKRDNQTLAEDQRGLRGDSVAIARAIAVLQRVDAILQYRLDREIPAGSAMADFVSEELLFPLRQRIQSLQQSLVVAQNGILTIGILITNNKELMRGASRAATDTVSALEIAVALAFALTNQKIVLKQIDALNTTTSDLIEGTSQRLKTQGAEIHKQASSSALDMEKLKAAFANVNAALDDISTFRRNALPVMAANIIEFDRMAASAQSSIDKMEKGNATRDTVGFIG
jgi:uncharacterized protein YaaN involved in tellurite resistance